MVIARPFIRAKFLSSEVFEKRSTMNPSQEVAFAVSIALPTCPIVSLSEALPLRPCL